MTTSSKSKMHQSKTRRERVEDREEAIIDAARDIFNEKSFFKATMAEIARAAGVADGTVYIYFKNKEDLARAVLAQFYTGLTQSAQTGVDKRTGPKAQIKFLARHHMRRVRENWRLLEMLPLIDMTMDTYEGSDLYKLNRDYVVVFDRVAKVAAEQGLTNPDTPLWMLRDIFFGAMDYGVRTMLLIRQNEMINSFVDNLVSLIFSSVIAHQPTGPDNVLKRLESIADRLENKLE